MPAGLDITHAPKRPFKGKGATPVWCGAIDNAREASLGIECLREQQQAILKALRTLEHRANAEGRHLPARLVRQRGGGLIWRKKSPTPRHQTLFEWLGPIGQALMHALSPADQRWCLDIEAERLRLNLHWTLTVRARVNLQRYLDRYQVLRHRRKALATE